MQPERGLNNRLAFGQSASVIGRKFGDDYNYPYDAVIMLFITF